MNRVASDVLAWLFSAVTDVEHRLLLVQVVWRSDYCKIAAACAMCVLN